MHKDGIDAPAFAWLQGIPIFGRETSQAGEQVLAAPGQHDQTAFAFYQLEHIINLVDIPGILHDIAGGLQASQGVVVFCWIQA